MCGIIGYTGAASALRVLMKGLEALEYRGYDSAGVSLHFTTGELTTVRSRGKLRALEEKLKTHPSLGEATCGIGHTRWATHGAPDDRNAHPHTTEQLSLVHNGIIENDSELREELTARGITFRSETDTEAAAWLIDSLYAASGDPLSALREACGRLRGSYAFAVLFRDRPGEIYAIRRDSPLILALTDRGAVLASDLTAILPHNRTCMRLSEGVIARLDEGGICCFGQDGAPLTPPTEHVEWDPEEAKKGGYPHFMRKEIDEQPAVLHGTLSPRLRGGMPHFNIPLLDSDLLLRYRTFHLIACGTAMHAGMIGARLIEQIARLPARVEIASEFRYRDPLLDPERDLCILLSQSGETADTLAALRHAKEQGVTTLAIVNVVGSSVAREADHVLYTMAGPEIAVASTKAYSVQCALLTLLALRLAHANGRITRTQVLAHTAELCGRMPDAVAEVLAQDAHLSAIASRLAACEHLFFIGRGVDADLCAEGSLKLKEISYIHSEAYPAGELKHGTISLIVEGTPVVALLTESALCDKTLSAIREVTSRGARVFAIVSREIARRHSIPCEESFILPDISSLLTPFPAVTALQLFAYHAAVTRGCEVDQPRNLAKSVTVE